MSKTFPKTIVKMAHIKEGQSSVGGGLLLVHADGAISMSKFPRGDVGVHERLGVGGESTLKDSGGNDHGAPNNKRDRKTPRIVRRLCDPKLFTGTAASGHLPVTVDLEAGVNVSHR